MRSGLTEMMFRDNSNAGHRSERRHCPLMESQKPVRFEAIAVCHACGRRRRGQSSRLEFRLEMEEEFLVPRGAGDRGRRQANPNQTIRLSLGGDPGKHCLMDRRVRHQTTLSDLQAPSFELRLHQYDDISTMREKRGQRWKDVSK